MIRELATDRMASLHDLFKGLVLGRNSVYEQLFLNASGPSSITGRGPPAPPFTFSFGAVSFLHRFGSSLNPHFHFHLCVLDGLFEEIPGDASQDPADLETRLRFHEATGLTHELWKAFSTRSAPGS